MSDNFLLVNYNDVLLNDLIYGRDDVFIYILE